MSRGNLEDIWKSRGQEGWRTEGLLRNSEYLDKKDQGDQNIKLAQITRRPWNKGSEYKDKRNKKTQ
jgi:hypothetical protein